MLSVTRTRTLETKLTLCCFSLALQREQYLREKKMGSDAYRKALDAQVTTSIETSCFVHCRGYNETQNRKLKDTHNKSFLSFFAFCSFSRFCSQPICFSSVVCGVSQGRGNWRFWKGWLCQCAVFNVQCSVFRVQCADNKWRELWH